MTARLAMIMLSTAFLFLASGVNAQNPNDVAADHEALRKLKADIVDAINNKNLAAIDSLLHKPFIATVITQDSFNDAEALKSYFQSLYTRSFLRINRIHMEADVDELSQIYTGTFAVARGATRERYELADGRGFDIAGRWTATVVKENGKWSLLAIHDGTNFLDNPVINAIERNILTMTLGGAAVGALLGFLLGFFVRRRRAKAV